MSKFDAPAHLAPPEAALFLEIQAGYSITDPAGLSILTLACESAQLVRQCREKVAVDGLLTPAGRPHPLHAVGRDARNCFLASVRSLGLDIVGAGESGGQIGNQNAILKRVK